MSRTEQMMEDIRSLERYFRRELIDIGAEVKADKIQFQLLLTETAFLKKFDDYEIEKNSAGVIFTHKTVGDFIFTAVFMREKDFNDLTERKRKNERKNEL